VLAFSTSRWRWRRETRKQKGKRDGNETRQMGEKNKTKQNTKNTKMFRRRKERKERINLPKVYAEL